MTKTQLPRPRFESQLPAAFLPVPESEELSAAKHAALEWGRGLATSPTEPRPDWQPMAAVGAVHVSLSRTVYLRHEQIEGFLGALRHAVGSLAPFAIRVGGGALFTNDTNTRSFVGLMVKEGRKKVLAAIAKVDQVAAKFDLPVYYEANCAPRSHRAVRDQQ